ncbi:MAG: hypothetical protein H0X25_06715 [Acidobacteriales bacterium]|nr:hypothetical protein [Terriglobales bacterium]
MLYQKDKSAAVGSSLEYFDGSAYSDRQSGMVSDNLPWLTAGDEFIGFLGYSPSAKAWGPYCSGVGVYPVGKPAIATTSASETEVPLAARGDAGALVAKLRSVDSDALTSSIADSVKNVEAGTVTPPRDLMETSAELRKNQSAPFEVDAGGSKSASANGYHLLVSHSSVSVCFDLTRDQKAIPSLCSPKANSDQMPQDVSYFPIVAANAVVGVSKAGIKQVQASSTKDPAFHMIVDTMAAPRPLNSDVRYFVVWLPDPKYMDSLSITAA